MNPRFASRLLVISKVLYLVDYLIAPWNLPQKGNIKYVYAYLKSQLLKSFLEDYLNEHAELFAIYLSDRGQIKVLFSQRYMVNRGYFDQLVSI